jgi:formimidoylglutamate deiminase
MPKTLWSPTLLLSGGRFHRGQSLLSDETGEVAAAPDRPEGILSCPLVNRALLPGLVNAHSHAFQRVIRGRTEFRTANNKDSFWTWREMMYRAAARLEPQDVYDASRMAFLEMALSGITAVGEFHYLHHGPDGEAYDDPNLLAREVVRAANDVGLRIALLRVAYARSGYETEVNPQQRRFLETDPEAYLRNVAQLADDLGKENRLAWVGVAPHSVRAVPLDYLKEIVNFANARQLPVHMHVAEQPAEVSACIQEYGRSPVALLATEGLLSERFTGVHMIHVTPKAVRLLADAHAMVCACPTTERNLGDGIVPVDDFFQQGLRVSLGSDSQVQIDLLEDARELEYHLRLQKLARAILDPGRPPVREVADSPADNQTSALAARLFACATISGAAAINAPGAALEPGQPADFFTVDLDDPAIAGAPAEDLLSNIVFSLTRTAIRDVVVGGSRIVEDGRHAQQDEIIERFKALQKKLWD